MGSRRAVMVVGLTLAGCGAKDPERTSNPPPPEPVEAPPPLPMPDPIQPPRNPPAPLPTWEEVKSGHPPGATNPPRPELIVTPEGDCYKKWVSGMLAPQPGKPHGDRVEACEEDCGTPVECPPKAAELLAAYEADTPEEEAPE